MYKSKKFISTSLITILLLVFTLLTGCSQGSDTNNVSKSNNNKSDVTEKQDNQTSNNGQDTTTTNKTSDSKLKVHYIDVGQADSILIQDGKVNMLIDAGNNADANTVVNYLKSQNISKLDYVIGTHPHEDHIGALDDVIKTFEIGKIYMPKATHTTKTFTDVMTAIKNKSLKIKEPKPDEKFNLETANVTILAPNSSEYKDLNDYSIVAKLEYGDNSFLFTGDAEDLSEKEMLSKGFDIEADVLKIGHHGSSSSTTIEFLSKISPKYAVIMCEKGNDYGHPHRETMDKLKSEGIKVYRTDENGTIVATSDGNTISFNTVEGSYTYGREGSKNTSNNSSSASSSSAPNKKTEASTSVVSDKGEVYFTPKGKSYHTTKNCRTLSRSKVINSGTVQEAINSGHGDPCDVCN